MDLNEFSPVCSSSALDLVTAPSPVQRLHVHPSPPWCLPCLPRSAYAVFIIAAFIELPESAALAIVLSIRRSRSPSSLPSPSQHPPHLLRTVFVRVPALLRAIVSLPSLTARSIRRLVTVMSSMWCGFHLVVLRFDLKKSRPVAMDLCQAEQGHTEQVLQSWIAKPILLSRAEEPDFLSRANKPIRGVKPLHRSEPSQPYQAKPYQAMMKTSLPWDPGSNVVSVGETLGGCYGNGSSVGWEGVQSLPPAA